MRLDDTGGKGQCLGKDKVSANPAESIEEPESNLDCASTLPDSGGPYGLPSEGPNPLFSGFC